MRLTPKMQRYQTESKIDISYLTYNYSVISEEVSYSQSSDSGDHEEEDHDEKEKK